MASPAEFDEWRRSHRSFHSIAAVAAGGSATFAADGTIERVPAQTVTATFFDLLRAAPIAGRTFRETDSASTSGVVVVSEGFWRIS
jgi:hypothetical protein